MGRVNRRVDKAGDVKTPLRLTRLRSKVGGAPKLMTGLNARNQAAESLPADPVRISAAAVLRKLPHSHPKHKPTFKVVGKLSRPLSTASGQGGSVSEVKPGHGAEPKPASAKKARAKKAPKKRTSKPAPAAKAPKKQIVIKWIKVETLPQTPQPRPFVPWPVRPNIESPPVSRRLIKFRTEEIFNIKSPSSQAEDNGSGHDSEPSGMPGAKRLRSREDFERQGKSAKWQRIHESAADGPLSSPSPSPRTTRGPAIGQGELSAF